MSPAARAAGRPLAPVHAARANWHPVRRYRQAARAAPAAPAMRPEDLDENPIALLWRPLIDLAPRDGLAIRLKNLTMLEPWLTGSWRDLPSPVPWPAVVGVRDQRAQVLGHAGLDAWQCRGPGDLPPALRTPAWALLVTHLEHWADLEGFVRAGVLNLLTQLTLTPFALRLAPMQPGSGDAGGQAAQYESARVALRHAASRQRGLNLLAALAEDARDPCLGLAACAQLVAQHTRVLGDPASAEPFLARAADQLRAAGRRAPPHDRALAQSRFHRARALWHVAVGDPAEARAALAAARRDHEDLGELAGTHPLLDHLARENDRVLLDAELKIEIRQQGDAARIRALAANLVALDPYCVEALLSAGDGRVAAGDVAGAVDTYRRAGEFATTGGAQALFRAAQCLERLEEPVAAAAAYARVLALDPSAVEPRQRLAALATRSA